MDMFDESSTNNLIVDEPLFKKVSEKGFIDIKKLLQRIVESGLELSDPRLNPTIEKINSLSPTEKLDARNMESLIQENNHLMHRILNKELVVENWTEFKEVIKEIFDSVSTFDGGENASYIPALYNVDRNLFGVSVCTIDGQRFDLGDCNTKFCIQSCSKPFIYLAATEKCGMDFVHEYVSREPSGLSFNSLTLKECIQKDGSIKFMPHNCMINAGAIMCCSILLRELKETTKSYEYVKNLLCRLAGNIEIKVDKEVYNSELQSADRNRCLAYMMREYKSFPNKDEDVSKVLDFYFSLCSVELTARDAAVLSASLANGGVCPITNDAVLESINVRNCLSQMLSCGMYDYSGEWAFSVGLPAKSGVSGCVLIVIPNKMGIAVYSPPLDKIGNSVKGLAFAERLSEQFSIHHLDSFHAKGGRLERAVRMETSRRRQHRLNISNLLVSASSGDLDEIKRLVSIGVNPFEPGIDGRTALHLAACEDRIKVIELLFEYAREQSAPMNEIMVKDTFGNTPLQDATRENKTKAKEVIEKFVSTQNDFE